MGIRRKSHKRGPSANQKKPAFLDQGKNENLIAKKTTKPFRPASCICRDRLVRDEFGRGKLRIRSFGRDKEGREKPKLITKCHGCRRHTKRKNHQVLHLPETRFHRDEFEIRYSFVDKRSLYKSD